MSSAVKQTLNLTFPDRSLISDFKQTDETCVSLQMLHIFSTCKERMFTLKFAYHSRHTLNNTEEQEEFSFLINIFGLNKKISEKNTFYLRKNHFIYETLFVLTKHSLY